MMNKQYAVTRQNALEKEFHSFGIDINLPMKKWPTHFEKDHALLFNRHENTTEENKHILRGAWTNV